MTMQSENEMLRRYLREAGLLFRGAHFRSDKKIPAEIAAWLDRTKAMRDGEPGPDVVCPECGPVEKCDEDGCCLSCGADLFHDEDGERTIQKPEVYAALGFGEPGPDWRGLCEQLRGRLRTVKRRHSCELGTGVSGPSACMGCEQVNRDADALAAYDAALRLCVRRSRMTDTPSEFESIAGRMAAYILEDASPTPTHSWHTWRQRRIEERDALIADWDRLTGGPKAGTGDAALAGSKDGE